MQLLFGDRKAQPAASAHAYSELLERLRDSGQIQLSGRENEKRPKDIKKSNMTMNGLSQKTALLV